MDFGSAGVTKIEYARKIAGVLVCRGQTGDRVGGKAEDVGGFVLAAKGAVQTLELGVT